MKKDRQINILLSEAVYCKFSKMCQFQGSYASTKARELIIQWVNENEALWQSVLQASVGESILHPKKIELQQGGERYKIEFSLEDGGSIKSFTKLASDSLPCNRQSHLDAAKIKVTQNDPPENRYRDNLDLFNEAELNPPPAAGKAAFASVSNDEIDLDQLKKALS